MSDSLPPAPDGRRPRVLPVVLILAFWAAAYLPGLVSLPLCDPEESRCAATVADMLRTGQFLVPRLDGRPYFEKPPLFYWLAAGGTALTGDLELGGRIVSALAALGTALCAWLLGRRMFSPTAGLLAGLIAIVSVEPFGMGRWYRMEALFTLLLTLAVTCFWLAESARHEGNPRSQKRAWYGFYFFAALAVLTKGPIGLAVPALVGAGYLLASGQWRRLREFFCVGPLLVFVAVAVPWFAFMSVRFPSDFFREFFVATHLQRAAGEFSKNVLPPGFYLLVLAAGFLPWTILLPAALRRSCPWPHLAECSTQAVTRVWSARPPALLAWTWAGVIVLFFEFSRTKFIHYVLPAFVPLALVAGEYLAAMIARGKDSANDQEFRRIQWFALIGAGLLAAGLPVAEAALTGTDYWAVVMLPAGVGTVLLIRHAVVAARPRVFVAAVLGGMTFVAIYVSLHFMPRVYAQLSLRKEGLAAAAMIPKTDRVIYMGGDKHSILLYAGRPEAACYRPRDAKGMIADLRTAPAWIIFGDLEEFPVLKEAGRGVEFSEPVFLGRNTGLAHARPGSSSAPAATARAGPAPAASAKSSDAR